MPALSLIKRLFQKSDGADSDQKAMLDHVPVRRKKDRDWRDAALKKAAIKHGRQFHCHTKVERVQPPSRTLQELEEKSRPQKSAPPVSILRNRSNA